MTGGDDEFPFPVVVLAFNRPEAVDRLLTALLSQRRAVRPQQIVVIQDGVINPWSSDKKLSFQQSDEVYQVVRRHLPAESVVRQERNLGIGLMYKEAYRLAFDTLDADHAVFLEDDFLPGPFYMDALMRLHELMREHPRIAFANALGYIYPAEPVGSQTVVNQWHLWGHLVSRSHWRQIEKPLSDYYRLIENVDYRDRPHASILDWFRSKGLGVDETSFDWAMIGIAVTHGFARVNTRKGFGELQKLAGVHMTQAYLDSLVSAETGTLADVPLLDIADEELDAIVALQLQEAKHDRKLTPDRLRNLSAPPTVWRRQVADAEIVRWMYRIILGREPSAAEVQEQERHRHSVEELREIVLASEEYLAGKSKQRRAAPA